ncbi:phospholipase D-like domain-containing protein [Aliarcobacter cryaerophilus]|uniref:PLD phosphodiesterase domain-containing protein n=1 Tax=Aliarcobacter cryaerophilus TaxID=28198 RepID=A0A5C0E1G1_9BACT|nr:phospholipase D-like domain-containing protein [Aliarcobacter cryaerophilus]MCT7499991.1 phospholipase D-like domain-containing protein [Aliarcobacter cryaerophilus]MCT7514520.1 phospholipase D-like domain-containing protein [Aliarcobacter cryaerophilus]MCT7544151.1 phospholipase D-like domain-containing protein [Aliarcobacter cryaerophilus]QEI46290.1 hypothetical protein pM830MA_0111 [Aliarcobacter cryaerophilus]
MNQDKFYNFDLTSLDAMEKLIIPSFICKNCRGINDWRSSHKCVICNSLEVKDLNSRDSEKVIQDNYIHLKKFVDIFELKIRYYKTQPVIENLCKNASLFIHFSTYTIDEVMLNFFKDSLKRGVQVAGVVGLSKKISEKIAELNENYPEICNIIPWECKYGNKYILPHQKFIIIDGVVGMAGSMNFTKSGFDKHDKNPPFELLWTLTNIDTIVSINNEYLSPLFVPENADNIWYKYVGDVVV